MHRGLVREALGTAVLPHQPAPPRARPRLGPVAEFIDAILEADRKVPRKQRHTAHRISTRGVHPKVVSEHLGHSAVNITLDTDSHVLPNRRAEAAERLADWLTEDSGKAAIDK